MGNSATFVPNPQAADGRPVASGGSVSGDVVVDSVTAGAFVLTDATVNAQTGTSYAVQASDNGKIVTLNNASAITVTVPSGLGAAFSCLFVQLGAGQVTFTESSTTLQSYGSLFKIAGQYGTATLVSHASDVFSLSGALTA